jgi:hypothetical protein
MIGAAMMGAVASIGGEGVAGYAQAMLVTAVVMAVLFVAGLLLKNVKAPAKGTVPAGH